MSKKNLLLVISAVGTLALLFANFFGNFTLCGSYEWGVCIDQLANIETALLPLIPLFCFSAVTYFMPERVFKLWSKFALVWVPLSIVAILLAPEYSGDFLYPIVKGTVAFGASVLFVVVSVALIALTYFSSSRK